MTNGDEFITFRTPPREKFAVILAGGDGVRMREMTKKLAGCETPKQFCAVLGDDALMTTTQKRVSLKFGPDEILYCLTQTHERFYTPLLGGVHRKNKIIQPSNQGTAPASFIHFCVCSSEVRRLSSPSSRPTITFRTTKCLWIRLKLHSVRLRKSLKL